jgi:hypothetical protein
MRFDYTAIISSAPDTGEPVVIFRPEVRLVVRGPNGSGDFVALVDTGADNTIMPDTIARDLGIPLVAGKGPMAKAFGGHEGCLEYFTATFFGEECVLDLEPNGYLPEFGSAR